ncbi:MAG TPA: hypothetical protein VL027_08900 [Spongiibacteraceae bacterium]|jgi:hypothetical protein|nr:hypothetical protein [Spongiibacteraceae bacterium]HUH38049.1 hypothetical protein [Spongiibacteraceae bacterium]
MNIDITLIWLAAQAFVIALVLCIALLVFLYRSRVELREYRRQMPTLLQGVPNYLRRESQRSRDLLRERRSTIGRQDPAQRMLAGIRYRWLSAEYDALRDAGNAAADDAILAERLLPVLKALQVPASAAQSGLANGRDGAQLSPSEPRHDNHPSETQQTDSQQIIDALEIRLSAANHRIRMLEQQIALDDAQEVQFFYRAAGQQTEKLQEVLDEHVRSIAALAPDTATYPLAEGDRRALDESIASAQDNVREMRNRLQGMELALGGARAHESAPATGRADAPRLASDVLLVRRDGDAGATGPDHQQYDDGDRIAPYHAELQRLQASNAKQRRLILQLDEQLHRLSASNPGFPDTMSLISSLKLQLRDSEICSTILENEAAALRNKLREATGARKNRLNDELMAGSATLSESAYRKTQIIRFLQELIAAGDLESVAFVIARFAQAMSLNITIYIRGAVDQYWLNPEHVVEEQTRNLLKRVQQSGQDPWLRVKGGTVLILSRSRYLFADWDGDDTRLSAVLVALLSVADMVVARLDGQKQSVRHRQAVEKRVAEARRIVQGVELHQRHVSEQAIAALNSYRDELNALLDTASLTDARRVAMENMTREFQGRLELLFNNRLFANRSFAPLISLLSDIDE